MSTTKATSEFIADKLRKTILKGELSPGERLPPERRLAEQFNVTRTTLREALKKLEQLKLVGMRQGQGITVQDFRTASMDLLTYLLSMEGKVDSQLMLNILEARTMLATEVTKLAAQRRSNEDLDALRKCVDQLASASDFETYQLIDFEFFRLLSIASQNLVYAMMMNTIKHLHAANISLFVSITENLDTSIQEAILLAVQKQDSRHAADLAQNYLHSGLERFKLQQG